MFEVLFPTHGEVLSSKSGVESPSGLQIKVYGIARPADTVTVNGITAVRCGERFEAVVTLTDFRSVITVCADGSRGKSMREIQTIYDKNSFHRANFCIDDNIFAFAEIARDLPESLFDHFYFAHFRKLHDKYGLKLTLNLFYEDLRTGFTLDRFPDIYKNEWAANYDWLKLAFHARAEFPDRPYQNADDEQLFAEYDQLSKEIIRFAGKDSLIAPPNIHWAMVKPSALPGLRARGVRFLGGLFLNARTRIGENFDETLSCDIGYFKSEEDSLFLSQKQLMYDFEHDLCFGTEAVVCNLEELPELKRKLTALISDPGNEALHLLSHEQYSFPFYESYLPDHQERLEMTVKMLAEAGFKFVFFSEGFLGNTASYCS